MLGIDDWAQRNGQTYGTILVDVECHRPVDRLPDRSAASVSAWRRAHPGVEIISRDRGGAYADGATTGAPTAMQVADRRHLLHNLVDALERSFQPHRTRILRALYPDAGQPALDNAQVPTAMRPPNPQQVRAQVLSAQRREVRLERFQRVKALYGYGMTQREIGRQVGVSAKTVRRWLHAATFPERYPRPARSSLLDPYAPYLTERRAAGCHNARRRFEEIGAQGYPGGLTTVRAYRARLRPPRGGNGAIERNMLLWSVTGGHEHRPSLRHWVWSVLRRADKLTKEDERTVVQLQTAHPEVMQAVAFAQQFTAMVRQRQPEQLEAWLWSVANSMVAALRSFATGIQRDKAAVVAGLTLEWSQGQVEGQINRLKLIKRRSYGRAKFDLLRHYVLYTE